MDFYDQIAEEYEAVTDQDGRTRAVACFAARVIARWAPASLLDVACGAGLFTLEFARRGVRVTGTDLSAGMLAKARRQAAAENLDAEWICAPMQELDSHLQPQQTDLILCMGNSLPHLLAEEDLQRTLTIFHQRLAPGGHAIIHLLNYHKVLAEKERIVGISRTTPDLEYVRFYDLERADGLIRFHVLRIAWQGQEASHRLVTTTLRPYTRDELQTALQTAGFTEIRAVGSLAFRSFDEQNDDVLLLIARR